MEVINNKQFPDLPWLCAHFMQDLQIDQSHPITVYCDNQAALRITVNIVFHEHTKHIELHCHVIHEKIQKSY